MRTSHEITEMMQLYVNTSSAENCNALWKAAEAIVNGGPRSPLAHRHLAQTAMNAALWAARYYVKFHDEQPEWPEICACATALASHWHEETKIQIGANQKTMAALQEMADEAGWEAGQ